MQHINLQIEHVLYGKEIIEMTQFLELVETVENQIFDNGIYKNGPTTYRTKRSSFAKPGNVEFEIFVPISQEVDTIGDLDYISKFEIEKCVAETTCFSEKMFEAIDGLVEELKFEGLKHVDDILYLTIHPLYNKLFVTVSLPYEE